MSELKEFVTGFDFVDNKVIKNEFCAQKSFNFSFDDKLSIPIKVYRFNQPVEYGKINGYLIKKLIELLTAGTPLIIFDFIPKSVIEIGGLNYVSKEYADDVFIFNPLDYERPISLFGDFKQETLSNLIRLQNLLDYFIDNYKIENLRKLEELMFEGFKNNSERLPLSTMLFLYDHKYFSALLSKTGVNTDKHDEYRRKFSQWNLIFNETTLLNKFLPNPFFVRAITENNECSWKELFMFFHFNLEKISLQDTKWMAETALIARLHFLANGNVKVKIANDSDHYKIFKDLNLFIIDDDIGIIDIERILPRAFQDYPNKFTGTVNIYIQSGKGNSNTICELPEPDIKVAEVICELSRLKWGSDRVIREYEFINEEKRKIVISKSEGIKLLIQLAFDPNYKPSESVKSIFYKQLRYEEIIKTNIKLPLGNIEDIQQYFERTKM